MGQRNSWIAFNLAAIMAVTIFGLVACFDDDDDDGGGGGVGGPQAGIFIDEPVEGLGYSTGTRSGETGADGTFLYDMEGDLITFTIGDILIGNGFAMPIMTPVDLVSDEDPSAVDETHEWVTNIARFLQTLDDDGDPSNGILITQAVRDAAIDMSVVFDQTIEDFENDQNVLAVVSELTAVTSAGMRSLVSVEDAQSQLHDTLVAGFAACYSGTFSGTAVATPVSGTFTVTANASGDVTGTFTDDSGMISPVTIPLAGEIGSSGAFVLTASFEAYTLTIEGVVSDGTVDGAWTVVQDNIQIANGTLTGAVGCSGDSGAASASYIITTELLSNEDALPNHFEGALCTIEVAENGTDTTVGCQNGDVLAFLATGTINGTTFNTSASQSMGTYGGAPSTFSASGTFVPATDTFEGFMNSGTFKVNVSFIALQ